MTRSSEDYAEQVYAGVLGKVIGVYLGRPVEGWPYEDIERRFGEVGRFVHHELGEPLIVADDDISGTFAFFRAAEDAETLPPTAEQVGLTWLNYVIERRTILWWGGVGRSTEHTAYFRLKSGTEAPMSGSAAMNGPVLPEQVGAQIFSDAFAMMFPGDPERAAHAVRAAASVSHDGIALDAAAFLGALRALAFDVRSLDELVTGCRPFAGTGRLQRVIDGVLEICSGAPSWRQARDRIDAEFGYANYPGPCHIVPNHAMTLASLLLGGDDFERSVMIAASAGFDTDSNAGCVGCLNGARLGLDAIPGRWRDPVADRLLVVSADGGSCVSDAAREAGSIVRAAARARGEVPSEDGARFDFRYRGSTQGFGVCPYLGDGAATEVKGPAVPGPGDGLRLVCKGLRPGARAAVSVPVFLGPRDEADNFSTVASPTLYPGQTVSVRMGSKPGGSLVARAYVLHWSAAGALEPSFSEAFPLRGGTTELSWQVPDVGPRPLVRLGLCVEAGERFDGEVVVEAVDWRGAPSRYTVEGSLMTSIWQTQPPAMRGWVSSAENFEADSAFTFALSHAGDFGVATTGARDWSDYLVRSRLVFSLHSRCGIVLRSVGHRRFYAVLLEGGSTVAIVKQRDRERTVLASRPFAYGLEGNCLLEARCVGREVSFRADGSDVLAVEDLSSPYLGGAAGLMVEGGTVFVDGFSVEQTP